MSPRLRLSFAGPTGVAVGPDRVTAADWSRLLTPVAGEEPGWADLADALRELRESVTPGPRDLDVALLPPMVRFRQIELPPLRDDELRAVLGRDAGRYLLDAAGPQLVRTAASRGRRRSPITYAVAFANARLVESVHDAATEAGWRIGRVVSAYSAWESGARDHFPGSGAGWGYMLIRGPGTLEALRFQAGRIDLCRRFPLSMLPGDVVGRLVEAAAPAPWFIVPGPSAETRELRDEVRELGLMLLDPQDDTVLEQTAESLAARWAPRTVGGELVPERIRVEQRRRAGGLSLRFLVAAAAMLLLAAGLELWGAHRELRGVREQRAAIREAVAQAMELRETIEGVDARLHALAAAEAGASRWSGVIADVAEHLPVDAHLIALRGSRDSLVLEGVAGRAAGVFESLQQAPSFAGARADAPIRREAQDSAPPVERFSLAARLVTSVPAAGGTQ